ncbi:MAG: aldose 1-epimerase [Azospirillaceae bacterium]
MERIATDRLAATIEPDCGGGLFSLVHDPDGAAAEVLATPDPALIAERDPLGLPCFPLVPYSGPVIGGILAIEGERVELARNHADEPEPIHGEGWISPWTVTRRSATRLHLAFEHDPAARPGGFPRAYAATLSYALEDATLTASLDVTNRDSRPMPAGLGLHPYFPKTADTVLGFAARGVWSETPMSDSRPLAPVPDAWVFDPPRPVGDLAVDRCFEGWNGRATLDWPRRGLTVAIEAAPPLTRLVVFAPPGRDFLCVEPVSNANDAHALAAAGIEGHGLVPLASGESLSGTMRLTVSAR